MWIISRELHSMLSLQYQSSLAWGFNHGNFPEEKAWFSLWHKHKQKGSGYDGGLSQHKHEHIRICKIENCIIFGSIPPQYSKTRWRNYAYAYSSTFLLDISINRRRTKPFFFLCLSGGHCYCHYAFACVHVVVNTSPNNKVFCLPVELLIYYNWCSSMRGSCGNDINPLTPAPPVTGRDEVDLCFTSDAINFDQNWHLYSFKFYRRKKYFHWYPDQSDRLSGAWNIHENTQKCEWKTQQNCLRLHVAIPW